MKTCEKCGREHEDDVSLCDCGHDIFHPAAGALGVNYEGEPSIGIGSGLSIDLTDGGLNVGGIDLDGD